VSGDQRDGRRVVTMRDRDAGVSGCGDTGRHGGHDLERHAGGGQRLRLLATPAEDEWVATLETHDLAPALAELNEQGVDLVLRVRVAAGLLADVAQVGVGARPVECGRRDQAVIEDRVGGRDQIERTTGHQARVAGPRADEVDGSGHAPATLVVAVRRYSSAGNGTAR
jgi:hypothetical protein